MNKINLHILGLLALMFASVAVSSCDDAEEGISYRSTTFPVGEVKWNNVSSTEQAVITELINNMVKVEACQFYMGGQGKSSLRSNYFYGFSGRDTIWNRFDREKAYWRNLKTKDTIWYNAQNFHFLDTIRTKRDTLTYTVVYKNGACWVGPVTEVSMPDYYIGKYEITQAEWTAVMGKKPSGTYCVREGFSGDSWYEPMGVGDKVAAYNIWYEDAVAFCEALKAKTGLNFRLPTEAEWECAARGGKYTRGYKYPGTDSYMEAGWVYANSAATGYSEDEETDFGIHPVGQKLPNELGLYDMCGNVAEWVANAYYRYGATDTINPGKNHMPLMNGQDTLIVRGGTWMQKKSADFSMANRKYCIMSSYADERSRQSAFVSCGFRICL